MLEATDRVTTRPMGPRTRAMPGGESGTAVLSLPPRSVSVAVTSPWSTASVPPGSTDGGGPHSGGTVDRNRHVPWSVSPGTAGWAKSKESVLTSMTIARESVVENPFPNHRTDATNPSWRKGVRSGHGRPVELQLPKIGR